MACPQPRCFAFVFPMASGHINPSLPIARSLVEQGHCVHYLTRGTMQKAIEDTGALWHSDIEAEPEMYEGRQPDVIGAMEALKKEMGLEDDPLARWKVKDALLEHLLPGCLRWLRKVKADCVVYCSLMSAEAAFAARIMGIPAVSLLTTAGPGSLAALMVDMLAKLGKTAEDVEEERAACAPLQASLARLREAYGVEVSAAKPVGFLEGVAASCLTLVTTCKAFADAMPRELAAAYGGVPFEYVGPLLDKAGAVRAAGHKLGAEAASHGAAAFDPVAAVKEARAKGKRVALVSMGTVITGDNADYGWAAKPRGGDGVRRGLTGKELCQAAWQGAFAALGDEGTLILVALGPQADALAGLEVPGNALCLPSVPQVDVLKAGVDVFLTHGGQNSFMEALATGVPLVVCPGFADQPVNARKAEAMGVGIGVQRPVPEAGEEAKAAALYSEEVAAALKTVAEGASYRAAAMECAEQLSTAGGVPRAVELLLGLTGKRAVVPARAGA